MPKVELIETRDGSSSLFLPEMNETYHSTHGAITESKDVFIKKGLQHFQQLYPEKKTIKILEIGFGTGLNAWITSVESEKIKVKSDFHVFYTSLEKFPLDQIIIEQLNYKSGYPNSEQNLFDQIHRASWNEEISITDQFSLEKIETDIFDFSSKNNSYDLIYFDAFAPSKQPEMWSPEVLQKMYDVLSPGGVFITYCAQGQFKRDIKSAGFVTEELPGPPGKKEMTRGIKP